MLTMRSMTKNCSAIRINLPRHAVGSAGLTQNLQVAIETFVLGKVEPGDFSGSVINAARQTITFLIAELVEPGKRSTIHLHKIALTITTETRSVNNLLFLDAVRFR